VRSSRRPGQGQGPRRGLTAAAAAIGAGLAILGLGLVLGACAGTGGRACQPVFSWASPAYGCAAGAAPAPLLVEAPPPVVETTTEPAAEPELARLGAGRIDLAEKIGFEVGSPVLLPASERLLDHVAVLLFDHPEVAKVRIEGHTDAQGSAARNLKLSQQRADAVRRYLEAAGVEPHRLSSKGFGETRPVADNRTAEGRELNRRVELLVDDRR
jgi:outer membrane protein OmpA-like peptidoglycan-associated protein